MRPAVPLLKFAGVFVPIWGCVGYVLGTATLIGPVRWVTEVLRAREAGDGAERAAVLALILCLVVVSAAVSFLLARKVVRSTAAGVRFGIPTLVIAAAIACVWVWMTPSLMRSTGEEVTIATSSRHGATAGDPQAVLPPVSGSAAVATPSAEAISPGTTGAASSTGIEGSTANLNASAPAAPARDETRFVFGPYPERERLAELSAEGYDAVVALLHPAVVPFEPKLLSRERKAAEAIGIELIHLPMLPWVGDNESSLNGLRELAERPGTYYVHCYLGRDRVRVAQAVVQRALDRTTGGVTVAAGMAPTKELAEGRKFERGAVHALAADAFLTPYPTDEEFATFVVSRSWGAIVSLLDPDDPAKQKWIEREQRVLERHGLQLISLPIVTDPLDPQQALAQVERARGLARPLLVHHFLGHETGKAPAAEAFLQAWHTGLPPAPPSLFREPLEAGATRAVAPNVVVGPRPASHEYGTLFRRGIRSVLYVGENAAQLEPDRAAAARAPLPFSAVDPGEAPDWTTRVATGGPWYVYGPALEAVAPDLAARLGPAIPDPQEGTLAARGDASGRDAR